MFPYDAFVTVKNSIPNLAFSVVSIQPGGHVLRQRYLVRAHVDAMIPLVHHFASDLLSGCFGASNGPAQSAPFTVQWISCEFHTYDVLVC